MDLLERAGDLKGMLVEFAFSGRFDRELSAVIEREFPGGVITDEAMLTATIDHFALQHRLSSGSTVLEDFAGTHRDLSDSDRALLLGWRDVVEGIFEVTGKERSALLLFNLVDELPYRARSNMGGRAFRPLKKGMVVIGRLVPIGGDWMVSGDLAAYPAAEREAMLVIAAQQSLRHPEAAFRNPAKLAQARDLLTVHHQAFVDLFGDDLIVVPGPGVVARVEEFHRHLAVQAGSDGEDTSLPALDFPDEVLDDDGVAIHFAEGEGLSFYPGYGLLEELFRNPALLARRRCRETLSGFLRDPEVSPEPLRRLAARDPDKAGQVFSRLLKRKGGFSWEADGEQLLRQHKPGYFDGSVLPRTVVLSGQLSDAMRRAREDRSEPLSG